MNDQHSLDLVTRDVEYSHDGTRMLGALRAPVGAAAGPGVLLIHDAFGLTDELLATADRIAGLGFAVFAADVWGGRTRPQVPEEIGPLIGGMAGDRPRWRARVAAARAAAVVQPEIDGDALLALGWCFGGSSALELLRTGGGVLGAVSIHGGLDLLEPDTDWSACAPGARVLLSTGADDPMATAEQRARLQQAMSDAGVDWEVDLYSGTRHAFTSPHAPTTDVTAYHPRNAARAWDATVRFLHETFPEHTPA